MEEAPERPKKTWPKQWPSVGADWGVPVRGCWVGNQRHTVLYRGSWWRCVNGRRAILRITSHWFIKNDWWIILREKNDIVLQKKKKQFGNWLQSHINKKRQHLDFGFAAKFWFSFKELEKKASDDGDNNTLAAYYFIQTDIPLRAGLFNWKVMSWSFFVAFCLYDHALSGAFHL